MSQAGDRVLLGRIVGVSGLQGWLKIHSDTKPREAIGQYRHWQVGRQGAWIIRNVERVKSQGKRIIGKLEGCEDHTAAEALVGLDIAVDASQLAPLADDQYYWRDLLGLKVVQAGNEIGTVKRVFDTGANDVLVVQGEREHLIPWILGDVVKTVDLDGGTLSVDWDPDF